MDFANRQGLVLAMLPTWGYYVKEAKALDTDNARAYGRWLGARYVPGVAVVSGGLAPASPAMAGDETARGAGSFRITGGPSGRGSSSATSSSIWRRDLWTARASTSSRFSGVRC